MADGLQFEGLESPLADGLADFAGVWSEDVFARLESLVVSPDLPDGFAESAAATLFNSAADIQAFFVQKVGSPFIDWFNANVAERDAFAGKKIVGSHLQQRFDSFWDSYAHANGVSLIEFIAYMCIFINERNGELISKPESFGCSGHPGISYLFDSFQITTSDRRTFHKASYNKSPNRTAGALFNDADFNAAHGSKPLADPLKGSQDPVWNGEAYPQSAVSVSGDPAVAGYVLEADFFKFRGRGLIQTTWRNNYAGLAELVQAYTGSHPLLRSYQQRWKDLTADKICTVSSNADWDALFDQTDNEIVGAAIRLHAKKGKYTPLAAPSAALNGAGVGSLRFFGAIIGGSPAYGYTVKARARQIALALAG